MVGSEGKMKANRIRSKLLYRLNDTWTLLLSGGIIALDICQYKVSCKSIKVGRGAKKVAQNFVPYKMREMNRKNFGEISANVA